MATTFTGQPMTDGQADISQADYKRYEQAYTDLSEKMAQSFGKPYDQLTEKQQEAIENKIYETVPSLGDSHEAQEKWGNGQTPEDYKKALSNPPSVALEPQSKSEPAHTQTEPEHLAKNDDPSKDSPDWKIVSGKTQKISSAEQEAEKIQPAHPQQVAQAAVHEAGHDRTVNWGSPPTGMAGIIAMFMAAFGDNPQHSVAAASQQQTMEHSHHQTIAGMSHSVLHEVNGVARGMRHISGGIDSPHEFRQAAHAASSIAKSVGNLLG